MAQSTAREVLVFLSFCKPTSGGFASGTLSRTVTVAPGDTRSGLLAWMLDQLPPEARGATVLSFSVAPNDLSDVFGEAVTS